MLYRRVVIDKGVNMVMVKEEEVLDSVTGGESEYCKETLVDIEARISRRQEYELRKKQLL